MIETVAIAAVDAATRPLSRTRPAAGLIEFDPLNRNTLARRDKQFIGKGGTLACGGDDFLVEERPPAGGHWRQTAAAEVFAADRPGALPCNCTPALASPAASKLGDSLQEPATTIDKTRASEP
jgi:hypothetical protein